MGWINDVVRSNAYKQFMSKLYGWGAAVVILGALFKITHIKGADLFLFVGLITESVIFFFSAFEPLHIEYDWSLVYPELAGMEEGTKKDKKDKMAGKTVTQQLDIMLEEAKIGPALIQSLADGMRNLGDNALKLSGVADAASATDSYVSNLNGASKSVLDLSDSYNKATYSINNLSDKYNMSSELLTKSAESLNFAIPEGNQYADQLKKISQSLSALNAVYELQLQSSNKQIDSSNKMQETIGMFLQNLNESVNNTVLYKDQVNMLTKNVTALNKVYGNMLSAMNVNVQ